LVYILRASIQEKGMGDWNEIIPTFAMEYRASITKNDIMLLTLNIFMMGREVICLWS